MLGLLKKAQGLSKILSEKTKLRFLIADFNKSFFWFYLRASAERKKENKEKVGGAELSALL